MSFSRLTSIFGLWLMVIATALLTVTACGGGSSGSPSRPPFALTLTHSGVAFSGDTYEIKISGGQAPYTFQSSNQYVISDKNIEGNRDERLYLIPEIVNADVEVSLIVTDKNGTSGTATILVRPSSLYPGTIWVSPLPGAPEECSVQGTSVGVDTEGYASICVGADGIAQVLLQTAGGAGLANRQIRFEWVSGEYFFPDSTYLPGQRQIVAVTDSTGKASVTIRADANEKTHIALIRATELSSGQSVLHPFMIATPNLSVFPTEITYSVVDCASVSAIISVYGGHPPYTVAPGSNITANPSVITENGGASRLTTTSGWCVNSDVMVRDSTGTSVTLNFTVEDREVPEPETPETPDFAASAPWTGSTLVCNTTDAYSFVATGGTPPYRFAITSASAIAVTNPAMNAFHSFSGTGSFRFTTVPAAGESVTVRVYDSLLAEKTFTLTCQ